MIGVFGSINIDHMITVDRLPRAGETVIGREFQMVVGGKGANQAVAASRCGAPVTFHGAVGSDECGHYARKALAESRVATDHLVSVSGCATGAAYVYVDGEGENQIVVVPGANSLARFNPLETPKLLVMQLEIPIVEVEQSAALVRRSNGQVILNTAPLGNVSNDLLRNVDVVIGNELEILGASDVSIHEAAAIASDYSERHDLTVIVTLGKRGALCVDDGHRFWVQAPPIVVVDTVGAGDGFVGAFAAGLHAGEDIRICVSKAVSFGSAMCAVAGAQAAPPASLIARMVKSTIVSDLN